MRLAAIRIHPVKSCAAIEMPTASMDRHGLAHDREFMVVDRSGRFLTQREHPAMAVIRPSIDDSVLSLESPAGRWSTELNEPEAGDTSVTVWGDVGISATDQGDEVAELLTTHLGTPARLVRIASDYARQTQTHRAGGEEPVSFADGFPLLIAVEESLADLNERIAEAAQTSVRPAPLPMDRFRPNLVISGALPWAEDTWDLIRVGGIDIDVVKPCARCTVTTVDQSTGQRSGAEPLRTLGTFRRGDKGVMFGQNAVHRGAGTVSVGDPVEVLTTHPGAGARGAEGREG